MFINNYKFDINGFISSISVNISFDHYRPNQKFNYCTINNGLVLLGDPLQMNVLTHTLREFLLAEKQDGVFSPWKKL